MTAALGVAMVLLAQAGAPSRSPRELADLFARKLQDVEMRYAQAQMQAQRPPRVGRKAEVRPPVIVTDAEVDSYLNLMLGAKLPPGLSDLDLSFEHDRLGAKALVDLERLQGRSPSPPPSSWNPFQLLSGAMQVRLVGRVTTDSGFGSVAVEEASLGPMPIAAALVAEIVARATRSPSQPQGVDITSAFRLPYGIKRVRLEPGTARFEF